MELEENVLSSLANSICDPVEDRELVLNFETSQERIGEIMLKEIREFDDKGKDDFPIIHILDINLPSSIFVLCTHYSVHYFDSYRITAPLHSLSYFY